VGADRGERRDGNGGMEGENGREGWAFLRWGGGKEEEELEMMKLNDRISSAYTGAMRMT